MYFNILNYFPTLFELYIFRVKHIYSMKENLFFNLFLMVESPEPFFLLSIYLTSTKIYNLSFGPSEMGMGHERYPLLHLF